MIRVRVCPAGDPAFVRYADLAPDATAYHRPAWLDAAEQAAGVTAYRLLAERDDRAVGMLPLARSRSRLFGDFMVSVPFGNLGGIVADDAEVARALLDEAIALASRLGCRHIEFRHAAAAELDLPTHTRKVLQVLDLTADPDELWNGFPAKVRNQVRKAEKNGLSCIAGGRELLDDFYGVFARNMRDLGTPVYAKRFFEVLFDRLGDALSIRIARGDDVVMGGMLLMRYRDQLEAPLAGTVREYNRLCPSNLMYWESLKQASMAGLARFDFGTSDRESGVHAFKKQWGAVEVELHRQYWLAPGEEMPHLNPSNPKYAWKINLWRKLPLPVANFIGPMLARRLP